MFFQTYFTILFYPVMLFRLLLGIFQCYLLWTYYKFKSRFHRWKSETPWKHALGKGAKGGIRICTWKKRQVLIRVMKGGGRMGKCQPIGPSIQSIPLPSNHSKILLREALQSPSHGIYLLGAEWGEPPLVKLTPQKSNF